VVSFFIENEKQETKPAELELQQIQETPETPAEQRDTSDDFAANAYERRKQSNDSTH
jgi:hypothetical protein